MRVCVCVKEKEREGERVGGWGRIVSKLMAKFG